MSEPRITITLGRSGQVVKRGENVKQNNRMVTGSKRYFEERPRATFVDDYMAKNKRKWGDNVQRSSVVDRLEGYNLGQNDLRLKLMHKRSSKRIKHVSDKYRSEDPHEAGLQWENSGVMHQKAELNRNGQSRWISSDEIADTLHPRDSLMELYSSPVIDESRGRSSDRTFRPPELLPPHRSSDGRQQTAPAGRSSGSARAARPSNGGLVTLKSTPQSAPIPVGIRKPSISMVPGTTSMGEEPLNISSFLKSLGLAKYAITLQAEEVDMATLRQMGDKDLKELGIPMGPRKKILLALMPKARRQPQLNIK